MKKMKLYSAFIGIVLGTLIYAPSVFGAIAFDSSSYSYTDPNSNSLTFSHTTSGENRILFVHLRISGTSDHITGVTYNGDSMTQVDSEIGTNNLGTYLYMLVNPDLGTANVVVSADSSIAILAEAVSYTGAKQTDQPNSFVSGTVNSTSLTLSLDTTVDNSWTVFGYSSASGNVSAGENMYVRQIGANTGSAILDSNTGISPSGTTDFTAFADSGYISGVAVSFAPEGTTPPPPPEILTPVLIPYSVIDFATTTCNQIGTTTPVQYSCTSSSTSQYVKYSDWLLVNSFILLFLAFTPVSVVWSLVKKKK